MRKYFSLLLSIALLIGVVPMVHAEEVPAFAIQPEYDGAQVFSDNGLAFVEKGSKWGVIDTHGNEVVLPKYDTPPHDDEWGIAPDPYFFQNGMARVYLNEKWGFIDSAGKEVIEPKYNDAGTTFDDGLVAVLGDEGWGYINKAGQVVVPLQYSQASAFSDGVAVVTERLEDGGSSGLILIDTTGKAIATTDYNYNYDIEANDNLFDEGALWVYEFIPNGSNNYPYGQYKYGAIDRAGNVVVEFKYDEPTQELDIEHGNRNYNFQDGYAIVGQNQERVIINLTGEVVASLEQFNGIKDLYISDFYGGMANFILLDGDEDWESWTSGYINVNGEVVIPPQFTQYGGNFSEGLAAVRQNNKYGFIDKSGDFVVAALYDQVSEFHEGIALVKSGEKYGFINKTGEEIVAPQYDQALYISNLIDGSSNGYFFNDVAAVERNGKWGFIDTTGTEVVKLQYDQVNAFNSGFAAASLNGKWGYISYPSAPAIGAPALLAPISAEPGTQENSTVITAVYEYPEHLLQLIVTDAPIAIPYLETDKVPSNAITLESNGVAGSRAGELNAVSAGQTVGVYETDNTGKIYRFSSHLLVTNDIKAGVPVPSLSLTAAPGTATGSVAVSVSTYNELNYLSLRVSTVSIPTPYKGSIAPRGVGVISPYISGKDIQGLSVGNYVGIYEVNSEGKVEGFAQVQIKASDFKTSTGNTGNDGGSGGGSVPVATPAPTSTPVPISSSSSLNIAADWVTNELKDSTKSTLTIDLDTLKADADHKKLVVLSVEVINLIKAAGKSITLKSEGVEWSIPLSGLQASADLTLTIGQKASINAPTQTVGKVLYSLNACSEGKEFTVIGATATIKLPVPADVKDAEKLAVYKHGLDGNWSYAGGRIASGSLTFKTDSFGEYLVVESTKTFADIAGHWSQRTVEVLAARQIATGVSEEQFAPNQPITRAEFAALLVRVLKLDAGNATFNDVSSSAWYAGEVSAAATAGIIEGNAGVFRPKEAVTRQEAALMLTRAYEKISASHNIEGQSPFTDNTAISAWASEGVSKVTNLGLMQGMPDGSFHPLNKTTRAESLTTLLRLSDLLKL